MKKLILFCVLMPVLCHAVPEKDILKIQQLMSKNPIFANNLDHCPADQKLSDHLRTPKIYFNKQEHCLANIGKCYSQCLDKDGYACYFVALELQQANYKMEAEKLFQKGCEAGVPTACTNRASGIQYYAQHALSTQQNQCITKTFKQTCAMNDAWGCTMYASKLISGISPQVNYQHALKLVEKSCQIAPQHPACLQGMKIKQVILNQHD